ncbi:DUF475 domain-containing protein [Pedococcus sp. KACC 23699]|uniref:DUF475 domain-containing protein n=1 Tax=Pedococcus sp. KACC 23699 TaxID=3149228 RepID=A0AAU7JX71_9MICO
MRILKHFRWDFLITVIAVFVAFLYGGAAAVPVTIMLIFLECIFSFDNAAVNAKYLKKMNHFWRVMFLSVGIIIAVVGMRLVFPFVIVCLSGKVGPLEAWSLAMEKGDPNQEGTYGHILEQAHPTIAAFGGMFLLMLFLNWLFDTERDSAWLAPIERPLIRAGHFDSMSVVVGGSALVAATYYLADPDHQFSVLFSGVLGMLTFLLVNGLAAYMETKNEEKQAALESASGTSTGQALLLSGQAAFSMFLFLEVLDASFSFDGVLGAFAVTQDPIIIAIGLGVGAMYVRSMTVYLVDHDALDEFEYMEHGAHWAIGILAGMLLFTLKFHIADWVIGMAGIVFVSASIWASVRKNNREALPETSDEPAPGIYASHPDHHHVDNDGGTGEVRSAEYVSASDNKDPGNQA